MNLLLKGIADHTHTYDWELGHQWHVNCDKWEYVSDSQVENIVSTAIGIERVIFNDPATIVFWNDGSKTVVKCQEGDSYDERTGLLNAIAKKHFGNTGRFNDVLNELIPDKRTPLEKLVDEVNRLCASIE